ATGPLIEDSLIRYIVEIAPSPHRDLEHMHVSIAPPIDQLRQNLPAASNQVIALETQKLPFTRQNECNLTQQNHDDGAGLISKAKNYIDNRYHNDIGIDEVSEFVGLSASHFCTLFKQVTGSTFLEYVTQCRIEKAKYILVNTEVKVY